MDEKGKGGRDTMTPPLLDIRPQSLSFCPYGRSLWLYNPSSTSSGKDVIATLSILPPPSDRGGGGDEAAVPPALHLEGPFFEYSEDHGLLKVESGSRVEIRASVSAATDLGGGDNKCCSAITGAILVNYEGGQETVVPIIFEPEGALEDKDDHIHALTEEVVRLKYGGTELMLKNEMHNHTITLHAQDDSVNHSNVLEEWQQPRQKKPLQFSSSLDFTTAAVEEKRASSDTLDAAPQSYLAAQAWWLHLACSNVNPIGAPDVRREQQPVPREQTQTGGGIGMVETDSNCHLCQQTQQLALDLSLSRQMVLEAEIMARTTAWEQEERLAAATLRIMALEAELRSRDSECDAQSAGLDEESSAAIFGHSIIDDKKERVTPLNQTLEMERKKWIDAQIKEKAQTQLAEFEQARYVKLKKRTENLVNELDRLKIASTVNVMEGPMKATPRMILESFVGVTRKQSERIAELEKMERRLVLHDNNNNTEGGGGIEVVVDDNVMSGGGIKVENAALISSLETERLSRRLKEVEGELRSARDKSVALERRLSSLLHFGSDNKGSKCIRISDETTNNIQVGENKDEEVKSISCWIEVDTLKSELQATLAHNIELKDALLQSESSVIPPVGALFGEVGLKHDSDNHIIPHLEIDNFLHSCKNVLFLSSPSTVLESETTVRLEAELQETRSKLKVLEMTLEVLQKSVVSEQQPEEEEVLEEAQSQEDGPSQVATFSTLLFTSIPTTKQRLVQHCMTLASEVNSLRTTAAVADRRATSLLRAVSSAESCRLASEGRLSAMEKRALLTERLAAEREAQIEALIMEGRSRLREAYMESQTLRRAIEGQKAQAEEQAVAIKVAQATSDAMEVKLLQFLDQRQQNEWDADQAFQNRLEDATGHVAATCYTATHSIDLVLSNLESMWANVTQTADRYKDEGGGHKGLRKMMKNGIFCSTAEKEELGVGTLRRLIPDYNSNCNSGQLDGGSCIDEGQLVKYMRLLAELLDAESLKALKLKAIAETELRWLREEVEILKRSLKEYHVEQCRLQARVKGSEQALLSCYLSSTLGRRQMVDDATISTHEQEELGVCADALLRHRAFAASERAMEAASQLALMRQRSISLKEEVDGLHRVLEEMRFNMEASEVEFHTRIAEAVGDALKESESSFRRSIEDKIECWFETELAPLVHFDGVVGLPVGEHLARVLAVCKAREAEALVQVSSYQMRFLHLLKQNEKLRAFVKSFAIHMKNSKPPIPHHSAGAAAAVTTDGQGSIYFYSETMSKAQPQQATLRVQLLESRDTANRFAAEASSLKCLVKKIREDEYNVRREAGERILQVQADMRWIKRGKAVNAGANSLFIPECSHFKHGLGGKRRNRSDRKVPQPQKQNEKRGEAPLCPRGSLVEDVRCGAHGYNNVYEEMLATSSSSVLCHDLDNETVKKYGTEQPGNHSNIYQHVTTDAVFDRLAAEAADSKARVEYLESLLSESSTLTASLLKDADNATVVSGGNWQASELMIAVRSVAATLEKMVKERGFKEAHMKHALARRERRIKELKAKLKHTQFIEKVASIRSPKGIHRFPADSVVGAANAAVKRSKGTKCRGAPSIFESELTEKATASGLGQQTSKESGGDATLLPKNNTYLINDEPQEDLICPGCIELTKLLKGSADRCLVLQHKVDENCVVQPSGQPQQPLIQVALEKETIYTPPPPREGGERKLHSGKGKRINCVEHESDESILTAAAAMMGKDAAAMDGESSTHLMGELLAQQKAHAVALEAMQTLQTELSQEASILREKNVELDQRIKVEISSTEDARSDLKASNAKYVELENEVIQANQKVTSQLTADNIALEEMSQAHKGVVRALKQSLMAVKAKAMINTATLAKRTQFVPDSKEKKQKYPDCSLYDRRSEAAILRSILVQSNTTLAELQIQLRLAKEESKVATVQLEVALQRLSLLMSTYESKHEVLLLPSEELEKEHVHLQDKVSSSTFQNNCMLNSVLQAAKLEILEAQCEEQSLLLNSMEEDLILARQQLELQEKLMDENVHLSNDNNNIKIIKPSSPSSTATHFCNVSENEKEQQRSTTTTTQAELSRLKELILQQANACPSSEDTACSKEKELESLKASLAKQKAEANRRGRALAALREVKAVNETEVVELKEKLKTCEEKLTQCLRRLGVKSTLVAQLKKQREELQTEVDELRRSSPRSTEERNAITTTTKERDRLRSQLTMYRTKVKSLTKTVELSQVNEASVKAAEEHASQSEAHSKELKREITRKRQDVMIWKQRAEECKMDAEELRNEMDLLKNNKKPEVVATSSHTTATHDALIDSFKNSLIEGVRSYARAGHMRLFSNSRNEIRSNRLAVAAMDTNVTGRRRQQHQHRLDSNIVSSMLGVTLNEAVEMMHCTSKDDDMDEFDWVSRAQCALLQWDGNTFWDVVREISRVRQPDGVLATSEKESRLASNLTGDKAGALLVDDETGMVAEWGECLQCAKEILSS